MIASAHLLRPLAACILVALLALPTFAAERIPAAPARYVTDESRTLSRTTIDQLNTRLEQFERESSNQVLVAIFLRMETDSSVEDYTVRVAQAWKVGQKGKNNGAVLFVFKQDRQIYIQVGYGLEPTLTDAICRRIVEGILKPRFRAGDFDGGVNAAVDAMIAATRGEFKGTGKTVNQARRNSGSAFGLVQFGFSLLIIVLIVRAARRTVQGPVVFGGPSLRRRNGPNIWWGGPGSGGGFGGGGWSGGGGGGGFSGGGGSFGGGGAGGKW